MARNDIQETEEQLLARGGIKVSIRDEVELNNEYAGYVMLFNLLLNWSKID